MSQLIWWFSCLSLLLSSKLKMILAFMTESLVSEGLLWLTSLGINASIISAKFPKSFLWLFLSMMVFMTFYVNSLLMFYMFFEISLIPILLMVIYWGNQPERISSGLYFLLYTTMFSIPYILMVLMLFPMSYYNCTMILISTSASFFILMPFLVKMPIFGLHFWLPKAHVEASTSGSMVLAGLLLKLGGYGVFRITTLFLMHFIKYFSVAWFFSSMISSMVTFLQSDIKKLIAMSSVTHMTMLMVSLNSLSVSMFMLILMLSLAHGWSSMAMFSAAGTLSNVASSRLGSTLSSESKLNTVLLMVGLMLVSNSSLPPFPSFFPELIMISLLSLYMKWLFMFVVLSMMICYYNAYLFMWMSHLKQADVVVNKMELIFVKVILFLNLITAICLTWLSQI